MDMSLSKLQNIMKDREAGVLQSMGSQRVEHDLATDKQQKKSEKKQTSQIKELIQDHLTG